VQATTKLTDTEATNKFFHESYVTAQGHMKSVKEGIRSIKTKTTPITVKVGDDE
jgi:DNA polymerase/3'-5' exonuclease PolX